MATWQDFLAHRKQGELQYYPCPGATRTVAVCSHIWWTEQIACTFHAAGFNVLLFFPFYALYTERAVAGQFDAGWHTLLNLLRHWNVDLILGGNSSAMLAHPVTGKLLHEEARRDGGPIPVVNWWWDEPRTKPPLAAFTDGPTGFTPADYLRFLADPHTLNAVWDRDVLDELEADYALPNLFHLPLATLPEFWPASFIPVERRPLAACFLGHCHFTADWAETGDSPEIRWAREIVRRKLARQDRPMRAFIDAVTAEFGGIPEGTSDDPWQRFARPAELLNAVWMHFTRNRPLLTAARHVGGKLALIGKGWDALGLRANMPHAQEKSGFIYAHSQVALNLFGGCVHGGMPLRPFDIAASGGLLLTHDARELPDLFEPGKECLAFRTEEELVDHLDRIRANPAAFNAMAVAGRRRVLAEHTWAHRVRQLVQTLEARGLLSPAGSKIGTCVPDRLLPPPRLRTLSPSPAQQPAAI
jgi:spore maturation protein CgeB